MRRTLLAGSLVVLCAGSAHGQQTDSTRRAARDSVARADSIRVQRELQRIRAEPRAHEMDGGDTAGLRLTRQQAIDSALAHNPTLEMARQQISQASARVVQAGPILPEPNVSAAVLGQTRPFATRAGTEADVTLGVTVPFPDKTRLRRKVARGDVRGAELALRLQQQLIVFQTVQAYDSLLAAAQHRADLLEARQLAQDFLAKTQARFNAGTAAKLDVIRAQVSVAQAENDLIASDRGIALARAALNRVLGRLLGAGVVAADTLGIPAPLPDLDSLLQLAVRSRPELLTLETQAAQARSVSRLASEFWLPDISVGLTRNNIYGAETEYTTGFGIDVPLFFWQHRGGEVAEAHHRELELSAARRDLAAQVGQDLRAAYATASTAITQAIYLRDQLLPAAREAYRVASVSYGLGGSSSLEVIDAQRTLLDAESQYVAALAAANDATADLERAVGAPLDSVSTGENQHED